MNQYGASIGELFKGIWTLVICACFYLCWWCISFRPGKQASSWVEIPLLLITAICGVLSINWMVKGCSDLVLNHRVIPTPFIWIGGLVAYVMLLLISSKIFHRMVTTELILIVGWAVMTLMILNRLYGCGLFSMGACMIFAVVTVLVVIASLYCYLAYYELEPWPAYIDGCVPLALVGIEMAAIALTMKYR